MPTLQEYLDNALRSVALVDIVIHAYFFMNQDVKKDAIKSLEKFEDLFKWSSMVSRLYNDLVASSVCFIGTTSTTRFTIVFIYLKFVLFV